ncbi:MAG: hypothetical protein QG622_2371 [Actinomycetota bacterium]|nr:hypothetical protein [Actinomycetota bacterium]
MSIFSWRFEAPDGSTVVPSGAPTTPFPSQADAETWIGETWRTLVEEGVEQVSLLRDGDAVYGPMSLRPSE